MVKKKLLTAILAAAVMVTTAAGGVIPAGTVRAAEEPVEKTIKRTEVSNPILSSYPDNDKVPEECRGTVLYGGDPSVMVEGDTVYLYTGRDIPIDLTQVDSNGKVVEDGYYMFEWQCYTTKDLKNWKYEGVIMSADKESITWASSGTDAWAGQITYHYDSEMGQKYYYFYNCTWDKTSNGKQSIGVAVADTPTGWSSEAAKEEYCAEKDIPNRHPENLHYVDLGQPLVKGDFTTGESSGWNDIDPTVWVETVGGVEHRYLSWGNNKVFVCELNDDMISIKDVNEDNKKTFGTQVSGKTSADVDVIELDVSGLTFTEAPWIYRRQDENGNYYGDYYLFYAYAFREQMAYATTDNLMDGTLKFGKILMPPTATSNTNHMAVFDFKGKTYFVYHNGSVRGGSGFRRTACITEMHFNEDGSIQEIPETAIGITGDKPYYLFSNTGAVIAHENYVNSGADSAYPYLDIKVGAYYQPEKLDASWAIVDGKADPTKQSYVSIQSENKPGLYLTVNDNNSVTLAHDWNYSDGFIKDGYRKPEGTPSEITTFDKAMGDAQTFRTVNGLKDSAKAVSFESVKKPGYYLCLDNDNLVVKALADCGASADFYLNNPPTSGSTSPGTSTTNDITSLKINGTEVTKSGHTYEYDVPVATQSVELAAVMQDSKGFITMGGKKVDASKLTIPLTGVYTSVPLTVYTADSKAIATYTVIIKKDYSGINITPEVFKTFSFEEATDDAIAVQKGAPGTTPTAATVQYEYVEGAKGGKAIRLPGGTDGYGLKLCDAAGLSENYSISYWMKPEALGSDVDPTLAAGTFSPEYWLNLTFVRSIWSSNGNFIDNAGTLSYEKDKWQLVTLVVNGNKAKLYVNGEKKGDGSIASDIMGKPNAAIYFGVNAWDAYFKGALDEVRIYDGALGEDEVMAIAVAAAEKPAESPQPGSGAFSDGDIEPSEQEKPGTEKPGTEKPEPEKPDPQPTAKITKVTVKAANQKPGVKTVYLKKGGKVTLAATVTGTGNFNKSVEWSTSKKAVATVSNKGTVKAKKAGTAKITVKSKADKNKKTTITVKVLKKAVKNTKLKLKATKKTLKKGQTYTVAIKSMTSKTTDAVTYKSSKSGTASIDKFGVVKAKKKGKAVITVKCGKKSAKLTITVK